ncbi:hypothetical protein BU24DRAFT_418082 [Aaosphaeria arxii CBS 175.79]|uniref:Uncharacterized protein n=1 Tax=Aaosphaeria arxii CBS 175.79 TaxID=1450172 RepID=A0A6A5Y177_9PLEO|nr:uncharacterized protein BU24DRAFT_418082 [Aaosphaeria arxii CBS 175.79]KAF2018560.1 hypothetical protein BU24DRAFT_418082 [Aaosphaeria arxii CBS 175.79]
MLFAFLFSFLAYLTCVAADLWPDGVPAKEAYPNCGTVEGRFGMGVLLRVDEEASCHQLRWSAVTFEMEDDCVCTFYRDKDCSNSLMTIIRPSYGSAGMAESFKCTRKREAQKRKSD